MGGNPNPKQKLKPLYGEQPLSSRTVALRLPIVIDEWVHYLPNKTEWLRQAIAAQYQRDMAASGGNDSDSESDT